MLDFRIKKISAFFLIVTIVAIGIIIPTSKVRAADHADSTSVAGDPGADIADVFAFLDPTDNSKVILAMDVEGFVVPSEASNLSFFAPDILYRFEIRKRVNGFACSRVGRI